MKPPKFRYVAPRTLDDAVALLASDPDAKVLSGGQSLMPLLAMRLAAPSVLVDLQHVPGLGNIEDEGTSLLIGARVTHREIERSAVIAERLPILSSAVVHIAHPQIRSRGTLGGSTAHADPSGEWPTILLALGATMHAVSPRGRRTIEADEFFVGPFTSTLAEDEILTHVSVPATRTAWSFQEAAVKKGDYGLALVAATGIPRDGVLLDPRVAVGAAVGSVRRLAEVERLLAEVPMTDVTADEAAVAAAVSIDPISDIHGNSEYRRKLVASLVRRAVRELRNGA
ncbi:xanthine dehydrogenase family protein subunit M [Microbacterium sp.]|uniref:FAD binding domain-containing protein n=1 Tax=Microbacterium sp. TaxID=51671 RepID=UPI002732B227|nr:xanthine dehydrogenase family protein subunit M [Microbacterium sp.]MDP3952600.1 xanthine dehydrogenase family protein subunit M [Microbacterium sp.]